MKRFPWRSLLYAVLLLYLLLDLKYCNGPLWKSIESRKDKTSELAKEKRWVAIVNREPITGAQLDLAVFRHLHQRGKNPDDIPEKNLRTIRRAVLQTLIDDTLVRQYADGENFRASQEEIEQFIEAWESQFPEEEEMEERSELQGLSPEKRRELLGKIWSRKKWLEQRIEPGVDVTDEEVREWFDANRDDGDGFTEPEKVHARHIFLSTVQQNDESKEESIREIFVELEKGETTFEELAKKHSEDERTKAWGGDLNWFAQDRVPSDFGEMVFRLEPGEVSEPFQTSIGWHIVKVIDKQEQRPVRFEEVESEIRTHLENLRTAETIDVLMEKLRTVANIRLFPEHF